MTLNVRSRYVVPEYHETSILHVLYVNISVRAHKAVPYCSQVYSCTKY